MLIHELHIDGFGIFANKHITGLTSGINIIYGPNEFGKSTILEFVRRILFGFPRSSPSTNPYPALNGGSYGGRLICELSGGDTISIHRTTGTHGGAVTIQLDSTELVGQDELNRLMGNTTKTFYENVYAISLDQLQEIKSLDSEEIRSRIYGAGLGLGSTSLSDIKREFNKLRDSLYKPRGHSQKMPLLYNEIRQFDQEIRDIQAGLSNYDNLLNQRDGLLEEVNRLDKNIRDLVAEQRSLESKQKFYPTYLDIVNSQTELSNLEELANFPEDALENLNELKTELSNIEGRLKEHHDDLRVLETKRDSLAYNRELIDLESIVISLQKLSEKYRSASKDIIDIRSKRNGLAEKIRTEVGKLGESWTEETIRDFQLDHLQQDKIRTFKTSIEEANRKATSAKDKLELHTERIVTEMSTKFTGPDFYRFAIYGVVVLGLVGVLAGLLTSQLWLAGFSAMFSVIGIGVSLKIGKGTKLEGEDYLGNKLKENLGQAESEVNTLNEEWREFLGSIAFDENLTPEGALEVVRSIENIQSDLSELSTLEIRIERMQKTIDEVKELHDQVLPCIDESRITSDIITNLEIFSLRLNEAKDIKKNRENLDTQINELTTRINTTEENRDSKAQEIQVYISSLRASDEEDLKRKHQVMTKRSELEEKIDESRKIIQSTVGVGEYYNQFMEAISGTTPDKIVLELEELSDQIEELTKDRDQKNRTIGELQNQIEQLSSGDDLLIKQSEREIKKQQLRDYSRDWVKSQIALVMFNKAISKYEETRQPGVINEAAGIFTHITNNTYKTIVKPAESNELQIRDEHGNNKCVVEMSRGTKEELYFAMRLGLIEEYEKRAESMPVIMDDILVNFDDERGPLAIQALEEFSKDRQVIMLTCHESTLDLYSKYGVNEVVIN